MYLKIEDFCKQIAGPLKITAISIFDCHPDKPNSKETIEVILVILDYQPRLMSYVRVANGRNIVIFVIDQWIFERDIDRGFLGEATVSTLVFPHIAIAGKDYLLSQEIKLKKRLIIELLENLVVSFPTLAEQMRIRPEYFMYETMLNRVRIFPPLAFCAVRLSKETKENDQTALSGYDIALKQLEAQRKIILSEGYVMIPKKFVPGSSRYRIRLTNISKVAPRVIFTSALEVFPQLLSFFAKATMKGFGSQMLAQSNGEVVTEPLIDPQRFIYLSTASGLVSLADRISVEDFARRVLLKGAEGKISLKPIGGVLNDVFLAEASSNGAIIRLVVKRFKNWSGFKWFPLNIWALGTKTFAVLGSSRLERECAISEQLYKEGFNVPKILHISHSKRLVFMEYIEGENLSFALRKIASSDAGEDIRKELLAVSKVGGTLSQIHSRSIALGDTKPENVVVSITGKIYLLDFEQASPEGDKSWDVAEFLYYGGHYFSSMQGKEKAKKFADAFIAGYLESGGEPSAVRKAGTAKYTRVFNVFTNPRVIIAISNACKNAGSSL